ncbi:MAG: penicillin-binding protein 1A [Deltaproteobacteria bacterium]|nr:penicillin-binding protein 1A [Deltaproteobacteria bacterium]MBW2074568.1 penicillin-binding protein 1A [Deltaproteobacteria bacterium]
MARSRTRTQIKEIRSRRGKKGTLGKLFYIFYVTVIVFSLLSGLSLGGAYFYFTKSLPKISSLKDYRPPIITTVYSDDNRKIAEFFKERRIVVPLSKMPKMLINAFVAAEDARFFKHEGVDLFSIARAFLKNLEAGTIIQGGSTITQQVAKSFFLSPEKSYVRKAREAILAYRIDKAFTKDEILFLYLNQIYLGHGAYGVEAAAENYFEKSVSDLNLAECALLAGLPQAPSRYSPFLHPERAKQRQIYVLNRMIDEGYITNVQATEAINTPVDIKPRRNWYIEEIPYYTEYVRRYVEEKYGRDVLYKEGLTIHTAVNIEMQKAGRAALNHGLAALDKRQGYRGPLKHLEPENFEAFSQEIQRALEKHALEPDRILQGVVIAVDDREQKATIRIGSEQGNLYLKDMNWARKPDPNVAYYNVKVKKVSNVLKVGDVILVRVKGRQGDAGQWDLSLEQIPAVEGALLCMEAETGYVKAMIGGRDFKGSQFNRAVQSRRQPGSAFKPIIYAAALDKGYTPATIIIDAPIVYEDTKKEFTWKPRNYEEKFHGPTLFRTALAQSRNVVTIKILKDIGIDYVIDYAKKLGIQSNLTRDLSLALGSSGVSLLELVGAYAIFNNQGYRAKPCFITKILDRDGNVLEENQPESEKVIEKSTAYIMTNLLQGVVQHGTGWRVKALNRPVAGKTGTTNDLHDAWFIGYTPRYVTGVWVGFDEEKPLGVDETGSRAASPIWLKFMQAILKDKSVRVFQVPDGVVFAKIDAETGLLAVPESKHTIFECFKEGTVPTEYSKKPGSITEPGQFFKSDM